ncbi:hypothetical protein ACFLX5_02975 [Chloroflexota bacterium]
MFEKLGIVLLAGILCLALIPGAVAADTGSQAWYLDKDAHPVPPNNIMTKTTFDDTGGSYVTVAPGKSIVWLADEPAMANVTFPGGGWPGGIWTAHFLTDTNGIGLTFDDVGISIGWYDGTFHDWAFDECTSWNWDGNVLHIEQQGDPVTINEGEYLALRLYNKSVTPGVNVYTDGNSFIRSPCTDPGYPLPELSTLVLIGSGLLGLGIYATFKRRKAVAIG